MPTLSVVLEAIRDRGTVSRVELAQATGLTGATITHAVRRLIQLRFVREAGQVSSGTGTPRRLLALVPEACHTVGIQFDRFRTVTVVLDLAGRVVGRRMDAGAGVRDPESMTTALAGIVTALLAETGVARATVLGAGVVTYGPQDQEAGVLLTPQPTDAWQGYPLADELARALGIPVLLENDATAAGLGHAGLGSARSSFATVYMAGGIGAGVMLDGQPYRGSSSNGVELGHISVDAAGEACTCGNVGCLENVAGPTAIVSRARADPALSARVDLAADTLTAFRRIGRAALGGDRAAAELISASANALAIATVTLVNLFDVARVVLAGDAFADVGAVYRDRTQQALARASFIRAVHAVDVELSVQSTDAAAIGGAVTVLRDLFESARRPRVRG
ncbi:ROK family transcriptional regulator [Microbacterium sp. KR10-403]|uniref:ROK family transcriptional regulator n=1 Tax=Microbacterium sp. KR10-403 TaxID=3158581 RepID=UPI0032E456B3